MTKEKHFFSIQRNQATSFMAAYIVPDDAEIYESEDDWRAAIKKHRRRVGQSLTTQEQKHMILGIVLNQGDDDDGGAILNYLEHIGFDIAAVSDAKELPAAILGHYLIKQGVYDTDKAVMDLANYEPVAAAILAGLTKQQNSLPN